MTGKFGSEQEKIKIIALIINDFESSYSCQTSYLIVSQRRNNKT